MSEVLYDLELKNLKRNLTARFSFLLSFFLLLLVASFFVSSNAASTMEYDSILLNIAGRQRMLIRQYTSETYQTLVGLASSKLKMALLEKKKVDRTAKIFEKTHRALIHGGEVVIELQELKQKYMDIASSGAAEIITLPPERDQKILHHLGHVEKEWYELKRLALLSLRSDVRPLSNSPYIPKLLNQASKTVAEMEHVVLLLQLDNELKLKQLNSVLLTMVIIGSVLFALLIYFVYSNIVSPLDHSIATLRHTTEKLEVEKTRAEKANAAKSEFLSRMSHELRTPMNAILGFGQLLEMDAKGFSETQRDHVNEILFAGHHLLDLINEVLDLARIESGKLEVSLEEVLVDDVLRQCITLIQSQAEARQLKLIDHVSGKGYIVLADFTRLKQVLLNLFSNAVKYNREMGSITLDSEIIDKQRLCIRVTDTGKGLSEDLVDKLFTPFDRLNVADNIEGTGIGLVITKHLVRLMGGTMGVESSPGKGSTFWIVLEMV